MQIYAAYRSHKKVGRNFYLCSLLELAPLLLAKTMYTIYPKLIPLCSKNLVKLTPRPITRFSHKSVFPQILNYGKPASFWFCFRPCDFVSTRINNGNTRVHSKPFVKVAQLSLFAICDRFENCVIVLISDTDASAENLLSSS